MKAAIQLAAPPTWVASIGPCLLAGAFALTAALHSCAGSGVYPEPGGLTSSAVVLDLRSLACWLLMLFCGVCMQSAVNTLNDYQDFKSGLDTAETILDTTDASLVYHRFDPRSALRFGLALLAAAALFGGLVVFLSSIWLLIPGLVAALVVILYSAGPKPISSLPLGEIISGVVMGGILTCATFYATTLSFSPLVIALSLVPTISIAQIMQTNNTCDIERDRSVGRWTLPGFLGLNRSRVINASLSIVAFFWLGIVNVWSGFLVGLLIALVGFLVCIPKIVRLFRGPYTLENRRVMMGTVVSYNWGLISTAILAVTGGGAASVYI